MSRRRLSRFVVLTASALAVAGAAGDARADVSSWLALGGGGTAQLAQGSTTPDYAAAFTYSMGVGTSPLAPLVVGLVYRGATYFGLGTDVGAAVRLATGGFARGDWGLALDAGALYRTWGDGAFGRWPVQGVLTAGSPYGLQLAIGAQGWSLDGGDRAEGISVALEIDLLRLTVGRQGSSERWWPNPNPAGGREKTVGLLFW